MKIQRLLQVTAKFQSAVRYKRLLKQTTRLKQDVQCCTEYNKRFYHHLNNRHSDDNKVVSIRLSLQKKKYQTVIYLLLMFWNLYKQV